MSSAEKTKLISQNSQILAMLKVIEKIASYKTTCLILGESGTGKELVARMIHEQSTRKNNRFIAINCGAIPENLLESELFGHEKGAFTGAIKTKKGLFEEADGGTLLLDEIAEMPLLLQAKLLRVLQEEEIRRVGDVTPIKTDVRIIAATLKDLAAEVQAGRFRDDLYYRLNVLQLRIPPLRDRLDDLPLLSKYFIEQFNRKLNTQIMTVEPDVMEAWRNHDWPGNVRELENLIERAMVMANEGTIELQHMPKDFGTKIKTMPRIEVDQLVPDENLSIKKKMREVEEELILKALVKTNGNRTHAAKLLEISHRALLYKMKEYNLFERIKKA
jgi:two-component system response regulator AtoC